jgi:hypothetical protein
MPRTAAAINRRTSPVTAGARSSFGQWRSTLAENVATAASVVADGDALNRDSVSRSAEVISRC